MLTSLAVDCHLALFLLLQGLSGTVARIDRCLLRAASHVHDLAEGWLPLFTLHKVKDVGDDFCLSTPGVFGPRTRQANDFSSVSCLAVSFLFVAVRQDVYLGVSLTFLCLVAV